jgi:hypothetical protein
VRLHSGRRSRYRTFVLELFATIGLLCSPPVELRVDGASCPSSTQMREALLELGVLARLAGHVIAVRAADDRVSVALTTASGDLVGERTVAGVPGCADRAAAASAIVAAWAEVPDEVRRAWPTAGASSSTSSFSAAPARRARLGVSAALSLMVAPAERPAPGLTVSLLGRRGRLALRLGAFSTATRSAPLGDGTATWRRLGTRAGAEFQLTRAESPWRVAGGLEGLIGAVRASGAGFPTNHRTMRFSPGVGAGLSVERSFGAWLRPFKSLGAVWWPRAASFDRLEPKASRDLPGFDTELVVGLALLPPGGR